LNFKEAGELCQNIVSQVGTVIVGKKAVLEKVMLAILANSHILFEDNPGLAKTLLARSFAMSMGCNFSRVQFTPDLLPADITGTYIYNVKTGEFELRRGPVFTNILLADEVNRAPPKTQAALLEAMQEFAVTYAGTTYPLERPFFILATQNPIEQSGTFPLPEAQLDRFLLYIKVDYPTLEEERSILENTTGKKSEPIKNVIAGNKILEAQKLVREVHINPELIDWVSRIVRSTRPGQKESNFVDEWVRWGAGPRAGQAMILTAKARALLLGNFSVTQDDIRQVAYPVLRHRILMNFKAEAEKVNPDDVTKHLLQQITMAKSL